MQNYLLLDLLRHIPNSESFSKDEYVEPIFKISCDTMLKGKKSLSIVGGGKNYRPSTLAEENLRCLTLLAIESDLITKANFLDIQMIFQN